jgi:hypothetical protein
MSRSPASPANARRSLPSCSRTSAGCASRPRLPICIGFGISGPEQVRQLASVADGLIVGSAFVRRIADAGRMFPTCSEVLEVIRGLGYFQLSDEQAESLGLIADDAAFDRPADESMDDDFDDEA